MIKPNLGEQVDDACQHYESKFGAKPDFVAAAPGRVNLIGEHIDYNDGIVLPMAVERYTIVAGAASAGPNRGRLFSNHLQEMIEVELGNLHPIPNCWANYVTGVIAGFERLGHRAPSFDLVVHSNIPVGAGLSSSAALEVAAATFVEGLTQVALGKRKKALLCQKAEHEFAGVPCGVMDQFASTFGEGNRLVKIDCRDQVVELVPMENEGVSFLVVDTKAKHNLVDGAYQSRRNQCESALAKLGYKSYRDVSIESFERTKDRLDQFERRRARHVLTEIERTSQAVQTLVDRDWQTLGELLYASHESLRDDFEVSCPELDFVVETCQRIGVAGGVLGARMTGGGFGGSTISLVQSSKLSLVADQIQDAFEAEFGVNPGAFSTRPAQGARLVREPFET